AWPWMAPLRGEARNAPTHATSSASTRCPMLLRVSAVSASAADRPRAAARRATTPGVASVRVRPGCTTVTLMPDGPSSSARFLVSAATETLRIEPIVDPVERGRQAGHVDDAAPAGGRHERSDLPGAAQVAEHLDVHVRPEQV